MVTMTMVMMTMVTMTMVKLTMLFAEDQRCLLVLAKVKGSLGWVGDTVCRSLSLSLYLSLLSSFLLPLSMSLFLSFPRR